MPLHGCTLRLNSMTPHHKLYRPFSVVLPHEKFNVNFVMANDSIKSHVESSDNIQFYSDMGLRSPEIPSLDDSGRYPGVHLNDEGNRKYFEGDNSLPCKTNVFAPSSPALIEKTTTTTYNLFIIYTTTNLFRRST